MSRPKIPMLPQFKPPMMTKTRAILSITFIGNLLEPQLRGPLDFRSPARGIAPSGLRKVVCPAPPAAMLEHFSFFQPG